MKSTHKHKRFTKCKTKLNRNVTQIIKNKNQNNKTKNKTKNNTHLDYKNIQISGGSGDTDLTGSILNYYYYSSHNSELVTSQLTGNCAMCIIADFITSQSIGGCIELDLRNVKADTISVDHYCTNAGLDFETILNVLIEKYKSFTGTKYPLIISIDANGLSKAANTESFGKLWNAILMRCFTNNPELRPTFPILPDTKMSQIMGMILIRWEYSDTDKPKAKDLISNSDTDHILTRINITKTPLSKTIAVKSINFNEDILTGIDVQKRLIRLYPKTPIFTPAFNYNFAEYLLKGVQMAALNLNLNNKYTFAYNEFFKFNKVIKIPAEIYDANTNIITKMAHEIGDSEEFTPDNKQKGHYCSGDISALIQQGLNTIDYDTAYKNVTDLISIIKEGCTDIEKEKLRNLGKITYSVPNSNPVVTYNFSIENDIIILQQSDTTGQKVTQLGGAGIQVSLYNVSVANNDNVIIRKYHNIFDTQNNDIYMHYDTSFNIFNIVYVNTYNKLDKTKYIGCLNLSQVVDFTQPITITLHKKEGYLKRLFSQTHKSSSSTQMVNTSTTSQTSKNNTMLNKNKLNTHNTHNTHNTQCAILPNIIDVQFKFEQLHRPSI